jgi:ABC-type phosphate transport system substrate-binding protein
MKKQIIGSFAATAALFAIAGIAQAAPAELNVYGASAQYTYWNAQAANYATNVLGCPAAKVTAPANNGGKHGFVSAKDCTSSLVPVNNASSSTGTKQDIDIRYSGIASTEGVLAIKRLGPIDPTLTHSNWDTSTNAPGLGDVVCNEANGERRMFASTSTLVCKQVHIGTSDVAGESLIQQSHGQKQGPNTAGGQFDVDLTLYDLATSSLRSAVNTVAVPFGFFVNNATVGGVTARTCAATTGLAGNYCTADAQCTATGGTTVVGGCPTTPATITNISREEAAMLFSGVAANWTDLGTYFTSQPVVLCLRHAGSGTHAALDLTVMNSGWGTGVVAYENLSAPFIYFNQATADETACIQGQAGAIGYADGDQAFAGTTMSPLKYNGFYPARTAIRNGLYDFYTNAWSYTNAASGATVNALADSLLTFAQLPGNVPTGKANYWASTAEMKYNRTADNSYPASGTVLSICDATFKLPGALSCAQTP